MRLPLAFVMSACVALGALGSTGCVIRLKTKVTGSGHIELTLAGGTLEARVNGSGDIHWRGTAQVERVSVSGSGEVSRR